MMHTRRYVNKAKYAPKTTNSLKPLDVAELLKEEIDCNNISFEIVSDATGIPGKRVERIPGKNEETLAMISLYRHGAPWAKLEAKRWLQKVMEGVE
jgi:hypothetical protein